jgi:carbohydrate kinase (thermoresistant glucokinase family)
LNFRTYTPAGYADYADYKKISLLTFFNQLISNLHCQRSLQEIFFENILKMIVIVMGVSGSGKSTIAEGISQTLKLPLYDADDFHPITNIKKMATGQPLNDEDRKPWLEELANHLANCELEKGAVLACSALKERYREVLASKVQSSKLIYLDGNFDLIFNRMNNRKGHFMKAEMLQSQFDALEIPIYGLHVDISKPIEEIIETITQYLKF